MSAIRYWTQEQMALISTWRTGLQLLGPNYQCFLMNLVLNGWFFQLHRWSNSSVNDRLRQRLSICLCKSLILDTSDAQAQRNVRSRKQFWRWTNQKIQERVYSVHSWAKKEIAERQKRDTYLGQMGAVPLKAVELWPFRFTVYPMAREKNRAAHENKTERNLSEKLKPRGSPKSSEVSSSSHPPQQKTWLITIYIL